MPAVAITNPGNTTLNKSGGGFFVGSNLINNGMAMVVVGDWIQHNRGDVISIMGRRQPLLWKSSKTTEITMVGGWCRTKYANDTLISPPGANSPPYNDVRCQRSILIWPGGAVVRSSLPGSVLTFNTATATFESAWSGGNFYNSPTSITGDVTHTRTSVDYGLAVYSNNTTAPQYPPTDSIGANYIATTNPTYTEQPLIVGNLIQSSDVIVGSMHVLVVAGNGYSYISSDVLTGEVPSSSFAWNDYILTSQYGIGNANTWVSGSSAGTISPLNGASAVALAVSRRSALNSYTNQSTVSISYSAVNRLVLTGLQQYRFKQSSFSMIETWTYPSGDSGIANGTRHVSGSVQTYQYLGGRGVAGVIQPPQADLYLEKYASSSLIGDRVFGGFLPSEYSTLT